MVAELVNSVCINVQANIAAWANRINMGILFTKRSCNGNEDLMTISIYFSHMVGLIWIQKAWCWFVYTKKLTVFISVYCDSPYSPLKY